MKTPSGEPWLTHLIPRLGSTRYFPDLPESSKEVERRIVSELDKLEKIEKALSFTYGTPRLGNQQDPVDELVYIILARKTREDAYQETFRSLKDRFDSWDELLDAPEHEVVQIVQSGGLGAKKTKSIYAALRCLKGAFGTCTLEPAREWSDGRLLEFLCSIPEIGKKSAFCIMMYSLDRDVFPVDTHVGRVLARLRIFSSLDLDLRDLDHKQRQAVLEDLIPPSLRYSLHVNLVTHGRKICRSRNPACNKCVIRDLCVYFQEKKPG